MATRRARRSSNFQSLDSLLDMMANVVGVLVVVMAVTQISVGDAMRRIAAAASEETIALLERRVEAEERWQALELETPEREELEQLETQLRALRAEPSARASESKDVAALEDGLAKDKRRVRELRAQLSTTRGELASLQVSLGGTASVGDPKPRIVRLPDPRPAPSGADPVTLLCRYERVFYVDFDGLGDALVAAATRATGKSRITPEDSAAIVRYFRDHDVGDAALRLSMFDMAPEILIARLTWRRRDFGETIAQIQDEESDYQQTLAGLAAKSSYLQFVVWNDSFDVYLEARRIAEAQSFSAGWFAYDRDQEIENNVLIQRLREPVPVD